MASPGVALQLYTVREDLARDFAGTLRAVAELGYPAVQLAGYGGLAAAELKRRLDGLGLGVAGNHVGLDRLENSLDEEIEINSTLGNRDLIVPVIPQSRRGSAEDYRRLAEQLDRIGERCRAAGLRLSYHNHDFEFVRFDGQYALDLLLGRTDPTLVYFEPDVYWIAVAGQDPAAYIRKYDRRCPIIHLKDLDPRRQPSFAEVGAGTLPFEPIFEASEAGGAEWYVVEQDRCPGPAIESARISLENLRRWGKL
jgi:sugar phosphate isomerase/epimerase